MLCFRALAAILLVGAAGSVSAQNFIINGDFDVDSHGWAANIPLIGEWATSDWADNAASGSQYFVANPTWGSGTGMLTQCVAKPSADALDFSFYSILYFDWSLQSFDAADCTGQATPMISGETLYIAHWTSNEVDAVSVPASTQSILVSFDLPRSAPKGFVDHVVLRPSGQIFYDGFDDADQ